MPKDCRFNLSEGMLTITDLSFPEYKEFLGNGTRRKLCFGGLFAAVHF